MPQPNHVPIVVTTRGNLVECVHHGSIAVVDADGKLVAGVGDPHALNFTRSSLKPLQVLPFVQDGGVEKLGFDSKELAIMCASHGGEPMHVAQVLRVLERIDAGERDLQCGCHVPSFYKATGETPPDDAHWTQLHHNCSGKHSGFLAYCRLHGLPLAGYLDPAGPLQRRIRETVREASGSREIASGIDGCSAPNHAIPLSSLAHAFARIATGATPELGKIRHAMTSHPELVSGTARLDLALMRMGGGDWVSKSGADGVQALGIRSKGLGIAVRAADASSRSLRMALVHVMQSLGLVGDIAGTPLEPLLETEIRNWRKTVVGEIKPVFSLGR
jgi:L-asparaginase II